MNLRSLNHLKVCSNFDSHSLHAYSLDVCYSGKNAGKQLIKHGSGCQSQQIINWSGKHGRIFKILPMRNLKHKEQMATTYTTTL